MKQEKISKDVQLNILVQKTEILQKSMEILNRAIPEIDKRINQIENTTLSINTNDLQAIDNSVNRVQLLADKRLILPRWLIITIVLCVFVTGIFAFLYIDLENDYQDMKRAAIFWKGKAVELGYKSD